MALPQAPLPKLQRGWLWSSSMGSVLGAESALPLLVALRFPGWFLWAEQDLFICSSPAQPGRIAGNLKNKQGILAALCHSGRPEHYRVAAKLGRLGK